jgi:site-specific DNA-methyltransferase (adenine-specific)
MRNLFRWPAALSKQDIKAFRAVHRLEDVRATLARNRHACSQCDVTSGKTLVLYVGGGAPRPETIYAAAHSIVDNVPGLLKALDAIAVEGPCLIVAALFRAQRGDALMLLPSDAVPLVFFDPQHRAVLDHLKFGNEGARQRGRALFPAMSEDAIAAIENEIARILAPTGYLMRWADTFGLCEAHHLRIPLKTVDLIAWNSLRIGMGKRSRRRGDYLLVLQKPPIRAGATWKDHGIPSRWPEKVERATHPHAKPIGL